MLRRTLCATAPADQVSLVFAVVFVFVWVGAVFVALNILLLGGKMFVSLFFSPLPITRG